jgi:hypothetical protein
MTEDEPALTRLEYDRAPLTRDDADEDDDDGIEDEDDGRDMMRVTRGPSTSTGRGCPMVS